MRCDSMVDVARQLIPWRALLFGAVLLAGCATPEPIPLGPIDDWRPRPDDGIPTTDRPRLFPDGPPDQASHLTEGYSNWPWDGGARDGGPREGGKQDGGARDGGKQDGAREGGKQDGGVRDGGSG